ncbi:hypothetical protein ACQPZP_23460 [Spirillospora sp. CA-142024]
MGSLPLWARIAALAPGAANAALHIPVLEASGHRVEVPPARWRAPGPAL